MSYNNCNYNPWYDPCFNPCPPQPCFNPCPQPCFNPCLQPCYNPCPQPIPIPPAPESVTFTATGLTFGYDDSGAGTYTVGLSGVGNSIVSGLPVSPNPPSSIPESSITVNSKMVTVPRKIENVTITATIDTTPTPFNLPNNSTIEVDAMIYVMSYNTATYTKKATIPIAKIIGAGANATFGNATFASTTNLNSVLLNTNDSFVIVYNLVYKVSGVTQPFPSTLTVTLNSTAVTKLK